VKEFSWIFWDFDGVIKDSVEVKTNAFVALFQKFGCEVATRVKEHHETHGGMSRFDKIPLYLEWAGEEPSSTRVSDLCEQFAQLVLQSVINAPWVSGVEQFLHQNPYKQTFVLVSATPQIELEEIINRLHLTKCFAEIFGSPTTKTAAISMMLDLYSLDPKNCLMIGDSLEDYKAAKANHVSFLLRRHSTNAALFTDDTLPSVNDFMSL